MRGTDTPFAFYKVLLGRPTVATPDSTAFLALVFGVAGGACFS